MGISMTDFCHYLDIKDKDGGSVCTSPVLNDTDPWSKLPKDDNIFVITRYDEIRLKITYEAV